MAVRIGTSGWSYKHWIDIYYPRDVPQRDWLAHYTRDFDTVEVNNSFYRLPKPETFDGWRLKTPPGFVFAVKASRFLTHIKKLKDPEEPLSRFFASASMLGEKLGPVLYQLPPRWSLDLSRLEHFLSALPAGRVHVIEFRDESWLIEAVFKLLKRYHVSHCIHDKWRFDPPLRVTSKTVYLRFHGGAAHNGDYPDQVLKAWARRINEWSSDRLDVFAYFNNDAGGFAVKNALALKRMIGRRAAPTPARPARHSA